MAAPEFLKVVISTKSRLHDMNDGASAVDQNSFAGLQTFDADGVSAVFLNFHENMVA